MTHELTRRALLVTGGAGLAASSFPKPMLRAQPTRPPLRIGVNGMRNTLEPVNSVSNVGLRPVNAIFDTLIKRDFFAGGADGTGTQLVPGLAESWQRENDRAVRVTLRPDVRFHDEREMTAEDVAYTFSEERLWGDEAVQFVRRGRDFSPNWDEPEIIDRYTVRLRTKTPSYLIEQFLASWVAWVVPADYYASLGPDPFGLAPIGTGPYRFVELRADDRIVLEPFDGHWGGQPTAGEVQFINVADSAARVAGLLSGEYDIVTTLTPDDMPLIDGRDGVDTRGAVIENFHMSCFQQDVNESLRDSRLRRAIAYCIDRPALNRVLWNGLVDIPNGFNFTPYGVNYDPSRPAFRHDPMAARRLLEDVGYGGETIECVTYRGYFANGENALLMMLEWWREAGLNIDLRIEPTRENLGRVDIFAWSNGMQIPDPVCTLVTEFGPGRTVESRFGWRPTAEYAQLCAEVEQLPDGPERFAKFNRLRDIFEEEMPAIIHYRPVELYGVRSDISWRPISFEMMDLRPYNLAFA